MPDERLVEVGAHYERVGGVSPLPALNRRLVADLTAELTARECPLPVALGNRNSTPFVTEALDELEAGGARRVLVVPTSAWRSYSSCRQYREGLAEAVEGREGLVVDKVRPFGEHPGFAATLARHTLDAARGAVEQVGADGVALLYVTHSIPDAMDETSGPGDGDGRAYSADQAELAAAITAEVDAVLGTDLPAGLAFCSRSGSPRTPWLEPDVNDRLRELADEGLRHVVVVPIGFVSDHMEVTHDLDVEAAETAAEVGLGMTRVPTPGLTATSSADSSTSCSSGQPRHAARSRSGRCGATSTPTRLCARSAAAPTCARPCRRRADRTDVTATPTPTLPAGVDPAELAAIALTVAVEAGELITVERPRDLGVAETKSSRTDVVTVMDQRSQDHLLARLGQLRPDDGFAGRSAAVASAPPASRGSSTRSTAPSTTSTRSPPMRCRWPRSSVTRRSTAFGDRWPVRSSTP